MNGIGASCSPLGKAGRKERHQGFPRSCSEVRRKSHEECLVLNLTGEDYYGRRTRPSLERTDKRPPCVAGSFLKSPVEENTAGPLK